MNKRIEDAIKLRICLLDYIRAIKKIDNTICGFEFKHYSPEVKNIDEFAIWKEWKRLADDFLTVKDTFHNCEKEIKMPILVKETRYYLRTLFKRTIVEAVAEIIVLDSNIDVLYVFNGGIFLLCSNNPEYRSDYMKRYRIPVEISDIFNKYYDEYPIIDSYLISDVMNDFRRENIDGSDYLGYKFGNMTSILIQIPKE